MVAEFLGQAFLAAYWFVQSNRAGHRARGRCPGGAPRDLRRRGREPPRLARPDHPRRRPPRRGELAENLTAPGAPRRGARTAAAVRRGGERALVYPRRGCRPDLGARRGTDRKEPFSSFSPNASDPVERCAGDRRPCCGAIPHDAGRQARRDGSRPARPTPPRLPLGGAGHRDGLEPTRRRVLTSTGTSSSTECADVVPTAGLAPGEDPAGCWHRSSRARRRSSRCTAPSTSVRPVSCLVLLVHRASATSTTQGEVPKCRALLPPHRPRGARWTSRSPPPCRIRRRLPRPSPSQAAAIEREAADTRYSLATGTDAANTLNVYSLTPLF